MNETDWITTIVAAVVCIVFWVMLLTFISYVRKTESYNRWVVRVAAENLVLDNKTGRYSRFHEDHKQAVQKYMAERGITEMNVGGQILKRTILEQKEKPPANRVAHILLCMGYTNDHCERIISKGLVTLGLNAGFDELLKFCLKDSYK